MTLEEGLKLWEEKDIEDVTRAYFLVKDICVDRSKPAERESYLVEPVLAKRKARDPADQDDEFLVELKRVKESEQPIVDATKLLSRLHKYVFDLLIRVTVFRSQGILGILEFFGHSFTTLKFNLIEEIPKDENTVGFKIHSNNKKIPPPLGPMIENFLFLFCFRWDFEHADSPARNEKDLSIQYDDCKTKFDEKQEKNLHEQYEMQTLEISRFEPLFAMQSLIERKVRIVESTFQEFLVMLFKPGSLPITKTDMVMFRSTKKLVTSSLKLSLGLMDKEIINNKSRMHPDLSLIRTTITYKNLNHYFIIGEIQNATLTATTAIQFLAEHKDLLKILLEGRSALKDLVRELAKNQVSDSVKKELLIKLFLFDCSGKVVILKLRPEYVPMPNHSEWGIIYTISHSKLYSLSKKEDALLILGEVDDCIEQASKVTYGTSKDSNDCCNIKVIVDTPMTKKSKKSVDSSFKTTQIEQLTYWDSLGDHYFSEHDIESLLSYLTSKFERSVAMKDSTKLKWQNLGDLKRYVFVMKNTTSSGYDFCRLGDDIDREPIILVVAVGYNRGTEFVTIQFTQYDAVGLVVPFPSLDSNGRSGSGSFRDPSIDGSSERNINSASKYSNPSSKDGTSGQSSHTKSNDLFDELNLHVTTNLGSGCMELDGGRKEYYAYFYCRDSKNRDVFVKLSAGCVWESAKAIRNYIKTRNEKCTNLIELYQHVVRQNYFPKEIFKINKEEENATTYMTVSEKLLPLSSTNIWKLCKSDMKTKMLALLHVIEGCLLGLHHLHNVTKLVHKDLFLRNIMFRTYNQQHPTSDQTLRNIVSQQTNLHIEDVVIVDVNNGSGLYSSECAVCDVNRMTVVIAEFISRFFGYSNMLVMKTDEDLIESLPACFSKWIQEEMEMEEASVRLWVWRLVIFLNKFPQDGFETVQYAKPFIKDIGSYSEHLSRLDHILESYFGKAGTKKETAGTSVGGNFTAEAHCQEKDCTESWRTTLDPLL